MKRFYVLFLLIIALSAYSQQKKDGYNIKITFKPFKNQYVFLGYYYGTQYPIVDSIKLDDNYQGTFKGDKKLGGGIYLIGYPDKSHFFEFLVDKEQNFSITADTTNILKSLKFENSTDNTLFNNYQQYMMAKGKEIDNSRGKLVGANHADSVKLNEVIDKGNKDIRQYREELMKKNPNTFLTTLLVGMREPEVPAAGQHPGGKYDSLYAYRYFKDHYWDGVNFYDERLARTTFFDGKLDKYFAQLVYPDADSVNKEIDWMLGYASANAEMKKFLLLKFVNRYLNQKYMWEDKVFVHLFEKYFSNQKYDWLTEKGTQLISNRAYSLMANILGTYASNVVLPDTTDQRVSLYAVNAPYTLVIFWDPTCSHCRETLPKIDSIYRASWKNLGLKVYSIGRETDGTRADWLNFIRNHHLQEWNNVFYSKAEENDRIAKNTPGYSQLYDIQSFPTLYLLDNEKRIIAKKLSFEQMNEVLKEKTKK
jgi:thiol-disulfide isomerase/thioredoxin